MVLNIKYKIVKAFAGKCVLDVANQTRSSVSSRGYERTLCATRSLCRRRGYRLNSRGTATACNAARTTGGKRFYFYSGFGYGEDVTD